MLLRHCGGAQRNVAKMAATVPAARKQAPIKAAGLRAANGNDMEMTDYEICKRRRRR